MWRLVDLLVRRPVVNARVIAEELDLDVGNVHRYIEPLLDARILVESLDVKRNQVWRSTGGARRIRCARRPSYTSTLSLRL